jgi:hypothetical protein
LEGTIGLIMVATSIAALWIFLPRQRQSHHLLKLPLMESIVPLVITTGITLGATMAISGLY